jgi:hypothetical protein
MTETVTEAKPKRKAGRPRKSEIEVFKKRNKVGRPQGDAGRIQELKARLLATSGTRVIDTVIRIALDDNHPGQMAALKMCLDRQLPMSYFDKDKNSESRPTINISISGITGPTVEATEVSTDVVDVEDING